MAIRVQIAHSCLCIFAMLTECLCTRQPNPAVESISASREHLRPPVDTERTILTRVELSELPGGSGKESLAMFQKRAELQLEVQQRAKRQPESLVGQNVAFRTQVGALSGKSAGAYDRSSTRAQGKPVAIAETGRPTFGKAGRRKRASKKMRRRRFHAVTREMALSNYSSRSGDNIVSDHRAAPPAKRIRSMTPGTPSPSVRRQRRAANQEAFRLADGITNQSGQDRPRTSREGEQFAVENGGNTSGGSALSALHVQVNKSQMADDPARGAQDALYGMIVVVGVIVSAAAACCLQDFESQEKFEKLATPSAVSALAASAPAHIHHRAVTAIPLAWSRAGPLCKDVLLPEGEICCSVDVARLEKGSGSVDLGEFKGSPLFRAAMQVDETTGREAVSISTTEDEVLGAVFSSEHGADMEILEVHNKTGQKFGELRSERGAFILVSGGEEVLRAHVVATFGLLTVDAVHTGERVGSASVSEDTAEQDHLLIRVSPNADPVLVLLCVFGVLLFGSPIVEGKQEDRTLEGMSRVRCFTCSLVLYRDRGRGEHSQPGD